MKRLFSSYIVLFAAVVVVLTFFKSVNSEEIVGVASNDDSDDDDEQNLDEIALELGNDDGDDGQLERKRRSTDDDSNSLQLCLLPNGQMTIVRSTENNNVADENPDQSVQSNEVGKRAKFLEGGFIKRAKFIDYKRAKFLDLGALRKKRAKFLDHGLFKRAKFLEGGFKKRAKYYDDMFQAPKSSRYNKGFTTSQSLMLRGGLVPQPSYQWRLQGRVMPQLAPSSASAKRHSADGASISMISNNGLYVKCIKLKPGKQI